MDFTGFRLEVDEVSTLVFNNPKINVFSTAVLKDFRKAVSIAAKSAKVLIITGEGPTFMAGGDIKELYGFGPDEARAFSRLFQDALADVENFPGIVVSAVNGYALGGGCELTLATDLVIASETAVMGQPEVNIGLIPAAGGTQRLKKRVGELAAKELLLTGRRVYANEALKIGLVNRVVPKDKLMEEAIALARLIASKPAHCIRAIKELLREGASIDRERELFGTMFTHEEYKELMSEFLVRQ